MSYTKEGLSKLLDRIFSDAIVEPHERKELEEYRARIGTEETASVFSRFVADQWGEVMKDGVITSSERALLSRIISELGITGRDLPEQAQHALRDIL